MGMRIDGSHGHLSLQHPGAGQENFGESMFMDEVCGMSIGPHVASHARPLQHSHSEPSKLYGLDETGCLNLSPGANHGAALSMTVSTTLLGDSSEFSPGQSRGQMRGRKLVDWRRALKVRQAETLGTTSPLPSLQGSSPDLPTMGVLSPGLVGNPT